MRQVSLKGMLEVTAGCGLIFTMWPTRDLIAYSVCFAVLALWSLRASSWQVRWLMVNWLGAISAICLGFACAEHALLNVAPGYPVSEYWLIAGLGFLVWGVLAGINGIPFLVEMLCAGPPRRGSGTLRRNTAT